MSRKPSLVARLFPFPKSLDPRRGTREYRRLRALAALLITTTSITAFWMLVLLLAHLSGHGNLTLNLQVGLLILLILGSQTWGFYHFANVRVSAVFLTMSYFFMVAGLLLITGGFQSPNFILLVTCPVISFRIGGKEEGIMNTLFSGAFGVGLMAAQSFSIPLENIFTEIPHHYQMAMSLLVTLTVIATSLSAYDMDE